MSDLKPLIVVTGATGQQGGSVAKFLLQDGSFRVRGTTRNAESAKAKALAAQGAEVVQADFDDLESVKKAFKGAYGVFAMTDFWDPSGVREDGEVRQGKNLVNAAKAEGIKHFIWSSLDRTDDPVAVHWNSKADVDDYLKSVDLPRTSVYTCLYMEAFGNHFTFTKNDDGSYDANWPFIASDEKLWTYSVNDTGAWVLEAFKKPEQWIGKDMRILTNKFTGREFVETVRKVSGAKINYHEISMETFNRCKEIPQLHELWANMLSFYKERIPPRDIAFSKAIYPQTPTMEQWVKDNISRLLK